MRRRNFQRIKKSLNNPSKTDRATCTLTTYRCFVCCERRPFNWFFGSPKDKPVCARCREEGRKRPTIKLV